MSLLREAVKQVGEITPEMSAEKVIERVRQFNQAMRNSPQAPVYQDRDGLLKKHGHNPEGWHPYINTSSESEGNHLDILKTKFDDKFPSDIEVLIIPGAYISGITGYPNPSGKVTSVRCPELYSVFIKKYQLIPKIQQ